MEISPKNKSKRDGQYRLILEIMDLNIDVNVTDPKEETAFFMH